MPSKATVVLVGHLGSAPELRYTQAGSAIAIFNIGVNDGKRTGEGEFQEHTSWYRVAAFGRNADAASAAEKGNLVQVIGRLSTSIWLPSDDREPRVNLDVAADSFMLLERKPESDGPQPQRQAPRAQAGGEFASDLDDIPF